MKSVFIAFYDGKYHDIYFTQAEADDMVEIDCDLDRELDFSKFQVVRFDSTLKAAQ